MYRLIILLMIFGLVPVLAQDSTSDEPAAEEEAAEEATDAESPDENPYYDDFELDLGTDDAAEEDLEVFDASIEVSYEQSVRFPTDI